MTIICESRRTPILKGLRTLSRAVRSSESVYFDVFVCYTLVAYEDIQQEPGAVSVLRQALGLASMSEASRANFKPALYAEWVEGALAAMVYEYAFVDLDEETDDPIYDELWFSRTRNGQYLSRLVGERRSIVDFLTRLPNRLEEIFGTTGCDELFQMLKEDGSSTERVLKTLRSVLGGELKTTLYAYEGGG